MHTSSRPAATSRLLPPLAVALAPLGLAACYSSYPTPLDGDRPDARDDARDTGDDTAEDDAGEVFGVHFRASVEGPTSRMLWLEEESATATSITLRLMVDADLEPVYGVAARLRWDGALAALHDVRSCGPFDGGGPALLEWQVVEPEPEAWIGLAVRSRDAPIPTDGGTCALLVEFDILGPGVSIIEPVAGRSAAVGSPPTRYATVGVGGGTLEVTR